VTSPDGRPIAVAGEAVVDFVLEPGGGTTPHLGGGSFNAARTLGRLGLRPVFIGRLSTDRYGRALRGALEESGVNVDGIVSTDEPTTFARVELDGNGTASYRFYLEGTSTAGLLPDEARLAMPLRAAALHVDGLGLAAEPQASAIVSLVREAGLGTLVMVDPNCRAEAMRGGTEFRRRLREVLCLADVVKASEQDLACLDPDRTPYQSACALLARGPAVVLLTNGNLGVKVLTARRKALVEAPGAQVIDTIGAGDVFGAAWLGGWVADGLGREDLGDFEAVVRTAEFAVLVAARTCERAGPEPPRGAQVDSEWCLE
jgi:fructokinase